MANFLPLKHYMFYCLDELIARYDLVSPFLDVGCGVGDVSKYLASKGWSGKAIDFSNMAVAKARLNLAAFPQVEVRKTSLAGENGTFETIILWDVLEHIEEDELALARIWSLLRPNGHLLLSTPSNPDEWRWDDDSYGHYRRYTVEAMNAKLVGAGLTPVVFLDFTYPVFWALRRIYTRLKSPPDTEADHRARTEASSAHNAWEIPFVARLFNRPFAAWRLVYKIQFSFFRNRLRSGHEMFVLARKSSASA